MGESYGGYGVMGVYGGPKTVIGGLVFALDARNVKTYDEIPGFTDHGISDWYCFISGTAIYSAIYSNTEIIEIDANGNETVLVTTGSNPQRGTFSTTAGRRYYGTKAVHLLQTGSDDQNELAPVSFAGTYFAHYWVRNSPITYYAYAPQDDTTLEFFDNNTVGGVTGNVTATHNISRGFTTSFQSTAINTWQFFKADKPIIMTAGGTSGGSGVSDKTILAPATQYNYKRRNYVNVTINNTTPSNIGDRITYDTSLPVATVEIADGAGGDCTQGIGYEYLSDTYSWGDLLSDFSLVSPYANNVVNVSYWENNQWNLGGSYSLNGTQTAPAEVYRNGNGGFDSAATGGYSGSYANFNTSTLWKFEGTQPFALIINDNSDDEERLLGWMSNKYLRTSSNVTQSFVNLIDKEDRSRMKIYGKDLTTTIEYAGAKLSASDYFEFDGVNDYVQINQTLSTPFSITGFVKYTDQAKTQNSFFNSSPHNTLLISLNRTGLGDLRVWIGNGSGWLASPSITSSQNMNINQWYQVAFTSNGSGSTLYLNGVNVGTSIYSPSGWGSSYYLGTIIIATGEWMRGNIGNTQIYNKALTASEVQQNYNATKSRYGL